MVGCEIDRTERRKDIIEKFKDSGNEAKNSENWEKSVKNELKNSIVAKSRKLISENEYAGLNIERTGRDSNPRPAA